MGSTDKTIRVIVAIIIAGLYLTNVISGMLATILLIVAAILIITSIVSFCPLYTLFGFSTAPSDKPVA